MIKQEKLQKTAKQRGREDQVEAASRKRPLLRKSTAEGAFSSVVE